MELKCLILIFVVQISLVCSKSYENYKTYNVEATTDEHIKILMSLEIKNKVDFWTELTDVSSPQVVMVSPNHVREFEETLLRNGMLFVKLIEDLEQVIQKERIANQKKSKINKGDVVFDRYMRYSEIQDYLAQLAVTHKANVTVENYGFSFEFRNLTLVEISTGGDEEKPVIIVDGGIHAREWLSPAQALYIIDQLLNNPDQKKLTDKVDWVIMPLLNPDGYEYSHTTDRLWRKTRSKGKTCDGVDPNRNFDFHWGEKGASSIECSNNYAGPKAFSEPETSALSKIISRYANRAKLYLTIHTPLQSLLYPYSYTEELPENNDELLSLGLKVADAIYAVNKTQYQVGSSVQINTYTSGTSRDWAYAVGKINLSYTVELPPYPESAHEMPPEKIQGVVEETFEGIKAFHEYVEEKYGIK